MIFSTNDKYNHRKCESSRYTKNASPHFCYSNIIFLMVVFFIFLCIGQIMQENSSDIKSVFNYKDLVINYYSERIGEDQRMKIRKTHSYIAIILIVFLFSACQKKESNFNSMNKTSNSTESTNSIPDEIKNLLTLGKYSDNVELNGKRDSLSIIKKNQKFLFPKFLCRKN